MSLTRGQKLALLVSVVMALPALSVGFFGGRAPIFKCGSFGR